MAADLLARVRAEIDARMAELRPALAEYERLLAAAQALELDLAAAGAAAGQGAAGAAEPRRRAAAKASRGAAPKPPRAAAKPTAAQQAIVAALEHGSHTVAELVVVTAMAGADIRESLRRLQRAGTVARSEREGRTAYVLSERA